MERLQKAIAAAGVTSRRKAEEMILQGRVKVNGVKVTKLGVQVSGTDEISVDGRVIKREEKVYFLMNKPKKTICSLADDKGRDTILKYMPEVKERVFPIGRLDYDTTGVLILTNDGATANKLMHPRNHFPKQYQVTISGLITDDEVRQLRKGVLLDDGMTLPAKVHVLHKYTRNQKTVLLVTIVEGRNREIRRMMEHFGYEVIRLERLRYGNLTYGTLRQGEYRRLRPFEMKELLKLCDELNNQNQSK